MTHPSAATPPAGLTAKTLTISRFLHEAGLAKIGLDGTGLDLAGLDLAGLDLAGLPPSLLSPAVALLLSHTCTVLQSAATTMRHLCGSLTVAEPSHAAPTMVAPSVVAPSVVAPSVVAPPPLAAMQPESPESMRAGHVSFGSVLQAARQARHLTTNEVAALMAVSAETIAQWEADIADPGQDRLRELMTRLALRLPAKTQFCAMGRAVRRLRLRAGLTRTGFAERVAVSTKTARVWEAGQTRPNLRHCVMMTKLFDVPSEYFEMPSDTDTSAAANTRP